MSLFKVEEARIGCTNCTPSPQLSLPPLAPSIAVQLLPSTKGLKELPLFLEEEARREEEGTLVIQYGDSWFPDLLSSLASLPASLYDFPVWCSDGLAWTSR